MLLRPLKFFFGQHFVRSDGRAFWVTNERRDILSTRFDNLDLIRRKIRVGV